jgi:glutamyl-tRNA reductase
MVDYLETTNITLINRSPEKADALAAELGLRSAPVTELAEEVSKADIILLATNATEPIILSTHLADNKKKLIIDLSIPYNVEASVWDLEHIEMVNVDQLSKMKDETLRKREAEVPKAKMIIQQIEVDFYEWYEMRKHVPLLKDLKSKLKELSLPLAGCPRKEEIRIQRVLNDTAGKIKQHNTGGCQYIAALHEFISATN